LKRVGTWLDQPNKEAGGRSPAFGNPRSQSSPSSEVAQVTIAIGHMKTVVLTPTAPDRRMRLVSDADGCFGAAGYLDEAGL